MREKEVLDNDLETVDTVEPEDRRYFQSAEDSQIVKGEVRAAKKSELRENNERKEQHRRRGRGASRLYRVPRHCSRRSR